MAYLLPGLRRSLLLTSPILLSAPLLIHSYNRPIHCDAPLAFSNPFGTDVRPSAHHTQTSTTSTSKSTSALNPRVVRQISMGSILGVLGGLGISVFSKPLAVLIGLGVVLVQVRFLDFVAVKCYAPLRRLYFSMYLVHVCKIHRKVADEPSSSHRAASTSSPTPSFRTGSSKQTCAP